MKADHDEIKTKDPEKLAFTDSQASRIVDYLNDQSAMVSKKYWEGVPDHEIPTKQNEELEEQDRLISNLYKTKVKLHKELYNAVFQRFFINKNLGKTPKIQEELKELKQLNPHQDGFKDQYWGRVSAQADLYFEDGFGDLEAKEGSKYRQYIADNEDYQFSQVATWISHYMEKKLNIKMGPPPEWFNTRPEDD